MSFEPDVLQGFVQRYLDTVVTGSAQDVAALYAEDATLEDPVGGGEVHIGRQAIAGFYNNVAGVEVKTELLSFRAGGSEAARLVHDWWRVRFAPPARRRLQVFKGGKA